MFVEQFISGSDNIALLLHDETSLKTIAIDAPDGDAILQALKKANRQLEAVLITHHHQDHTAGISLLKKETGAKIYGPGRDLAAQAHKSKEFDLTQYSGQIAGLDQGLEDGQKFSVAGFEFEVMATPGHTLDGISFYMAKEQAVFTGDTLFSLGCGRVFEGDNVMMYRSLQKLNALPAATQIYCGHEYSANNARFAASVEPSNKDLQNRTAEINALRAQNKITLPSSLQQEQQTNPFLRCSATEIRHNLKCSTTSSDEEVFAKLRHLKDIF